MCQIIFHLFRFYHAEIHRKLWPKAPAKEGALSQTTNNFQVYFIHINSFKTPNKKNLQWSQRVILRCYYICFLFFIVYLPIKMETEKWPKAVDSPLICVFFLFKIFFNFDFFINFKPKPRRFSPMVEKKLFSQIEFTVQILFKSITSNSVIFSFLSYFGWYWPQNFFQKI